MNGFEFQVRDQIADEISLELVADPSIAIGR
jgi:hypothetical protein